MVVYIIRQWNKNNHISLAREERKGKLKGNPKRWGRFAVD